MQNKVRYEYILIVITNISKQDFSTCAGTSRFIGIDSNLHPARLQLCRCCIKPVFQVLRGFLHAFYERYFKETKQKTIKGASIHGKIIIINVTSTAERLAPSCGKDPFTAHQRHQAVSSGDFCFLFKSQYTLICFFPF